MGNICTLYVLGRNYVYFGVLQVHICTHSTDMNVSVVHLRNVISSYPQTLLSSFRSFWTAERRSHQNWKHRFLLTLSVFFFFFGWNGGTRCLWVMSHKLLYRLGSCIPRNEYNVDCGMCILCVGYAQNESERKNYCMCAARTSKIEFPTTTNSQSLPFSRLLAHFLALQFPTTPIRCDVNLFWLLRFYVLVERALSFSALCFGSALLLLFRIVFHAF